MRILLLSGYDAASHQCWREGLSDFFKQIDSTVTFDQLALPPRYFNWRIRGNGLYWSQECTATLTAGHDVLLATSMVDLATLRGLLPALAQTPTILYFHENQFAYPLSDRAEGQRNLEPLMVQLYSAIAADQLVFNSQYNQHSFTAGIENLLKKFPDFVPSPAHLCDKLLKKSCVLPVPIERPEATIHEKRTHSVIWNHRWEYDKGPERLLACIEALPSNLPCTFHIVGQSFRSVPNEFMQIKSILEQRGWMGAWGFQTSRQDYERLLQSTQCVLSTAVHDFQGLAVLEAVSQGCIPVVPERLAYTEWFDKAFRYRTSAAKQEGRTAAEQLQAVWTSPPVPPNVTGFFWENLGPQYAQLFISTINRRSV